MCLTKLETLHAGLSVQLLDTDQDAALNRYKKKGKLNNQIADRNYC